MNVVRPGDVILVHFLHTQAIGLHFARHRNSWPLHITLIPWFATPDKPMLQTKLTELSTDNHPLTSTFTEHVNFNLQTKVTLLDTTPELRKLHLDLLDVAVLSGTGIIASDWVAEKYKPHVTHHDGQPIPRVTDRILIDNFSLVQLLPGNMCEVLSHFALGPKR